MKIIIVGAGIGGLSAALSLALAGHNVLILESASALAEVGAGVQMTPCATKCFWKWGLGPDILTNSALPESFNLRRDVDGEILGCVSFGDFEEQYGAPYIVIHRADIHRVLHEHAANAGVEVRLGSRVIHYDFDEGLVRLASGEELQADIIVAVDGINSMARQAFLRDDGDGLEKTGWAAYRTMVPVDKIKANSKTAHIVSRHKCNCWAGDQRLIMTYLVKNAEMLNLVLSHPDDVDTTKWAPEQYLAEIQRLFSDWDPSLRALLDMASPNIQNWPVYQVKSLPQWTSKTGKFVLMGDAAHAMAFYLSMGVSMAVEDAAALTECLDLVQQGKTTLDQAMGIFETVRKSRAEAVRDASLHAGDILNLPPGPARDSRNEALKSDGESLGVINDERFFVKKNSYGIGDKQIRDWAYSYDVVKAVRTEWDRVQKSN